MTALVLKDVSSLKKHIIRFNKQKIYTYNKYILVNNVLVQFHSAINPKKLCFNNFHLLFTFTMNNLNIQTLSVNKKNIAFTLKASENKVVTKQ